MSNSITPDDGSVVNQPTTIAITDATSTGVVNFVVWDVDLITKQVELKYWEVESAD